MSRQEKRASDRRLRKALRKISLAAGEGVGRAVAFSFALASNAFAAEPKKEETFNLPPVVVQDQNNPYVPPESSLSRIPVPLQDVPQSITIVPQRLMQERAASSFQDALEKCSGYRFCRRAKVGAQGDSFTLRGFNARNDFYLDGVRDQGSYFRDIFNLESVEVLKGPSSHYFGRGSTGGIINQVSKIPQLDPAMAELSVWATALCPRHGRRQPADHPDDRFAFQPDGTQRRYRRQGYRAARRLGFAPSISFGLGTPTQLNLSYLVQDEDNIPDYGVPYHPGNPGKPARVKRDNFYGFDHEDYERTLLNLGTLRLDHRFNDIFSLRNTMRFSHNDREHEVTAPRFNAATPGFFNRNRPKRDLTRDDSRAIKRISPPNSILWASSIR